MIAPLDADGRLQKAIAAAVATARRQAAWLAVQLPQGSGAAQEVKIPKGATLSGVVTALERAGVVTRPTFFRLYANHRGVAGENRTELTFDLGVAGEHLVARKPSAQLHAPRAGRPLADSPLQLRDAVAKLVTTLRHRGYSAGEIAAELHRTLGALDG